MATSKLDILLNAKNNASGPIKQVSGDLDDLEKSVNLTGVAMGALAGVATVGTIAALGSLAVSAVDTAAQFQRLEMSFQRLATQAGASADDMLNAMREASHGMIADADLILAANKAMGLGVADSVEDVVALLNLAAEKGQQAGLSMTQAFDDLVTGLGRGSALILDNLYITVDAAAANEKYAESLGKVASELSEAEKKQALINATLAQSSGEVSIVINEAEQLATSWQNAKNAWADAVTQGGHLANILGAIAQGIQLASNASQGATSMGAQYAQLSTRLEMANAQIEHYTARRKEANVSEREAIAIEKELERLTAVRADLMGQLGVVTQQEGAALAGYYNEASYIAQQAQQEQQALQAEIDETTRRLGALEAHAASVQSSIISGLISGATAASGGDAIAGYNLALEKSAELQSKIGATVLETGLTYDEVVKYIMPQWLSQTNDVWRETEKVSTAVSEAEREYNRLLDTVGNVLSGALNVSSDVGIDLDSLLPRQDAINEDARRLADVAVRGWESPWADYFRTEFPALWAEAFRGTENGGDIKLQAAEILRQFESGLRPELIDKELAKERVRQMLVGDANLAEIAQEIAAELSEEMGGINSAAIQSAIGRTLGLVDFGGDQGTDAGAEFGSGAVGGVSGYGTEVVATFTAELKLESNLELVRNTGTAYGVQWGNSFLAQVGSNVPQALIDILVSLVTPGVQAGLRTQASLEGAQ